MATLRVSPRPARLLAIAAVLGVLATVVNLPPVREFLTRATPVGRLAGRAGPTEATLAAARRLLDNGRGADAAALLQPLIAAGRAEVPVVLLTARAAAAAGDTRTADLLFESARVGAPDDPEAQARVGEYLASRGFDRAAAAQFEVALRLKPNHPTVLRGQAERALRAHHFSEALALADRAEQDAPTWEGARLRAEALKELGQVEAAEEAAREAVALAFHPLTLRTLAGVLVLTPGPDRLAESCRLLQDALRRDPTQTGAMRLLAMNLRALGEHRSAIRVLRRLLRAEPLSLEAYPLLAQSYQATGRAPLAAAVRRIYAELQPVDERVARARFLAGVARGSPDSLLGLARAYVAAGRPDEARRLLAKPPLGSRSGPAIERLRREIAGSPTLRIPALPEDPLGDRT